MYTRSASIPGTDRKSGDVKGLLTNNHKSPQVFALCRLYDNSDNSQTVGPSSNLVSLSSPSIIHHVGEIILSHMCLLTLNHESLQM